MFVNAQSSSASNKKKGLRICVRSEAFLTTFACLYVSRRLNYKFLGFCPFQHYLIMNWYARINGQEYGPVTVQQLQQWAMENRILATTEVRQGETGTWIQAGQVQGLMPTAMPQAQSLNTTSAPQVTTSGPSVKTTNASSRYRKTRRRSNKTGDDTLTIWLVCGSIFVVGLGCLLGVLYLAQNTSSPTRSPSRSGKPKPPAVEYTATELMSLYQENSIRADQACKDKAFGVTGAISNIGTDLLGTPFVAFESGELIFLVQCMFDDSDKGQLAKLKPGDSVRIRGTCKGKLGNIIFDNCSFY